MHCCLANLNGGDITLIPVCCPHSPFAAKLLLEQLRQQSGQDVVGQLADDVEGVDELRRLARECRADLDNLALQTAEAHCQEGPVAVQQLIAASSMQRQPQQQQRRRPGMESPAEQQQQAFASPRSGEHPPALV